jgi:hypothetical protein
VGRIRRLLRTAFNIFPALKGRDFHHWRPMFEPGDQQMPIPSFAAGDFTLADSGNCIFRVYGSSPDGSLPARVAELVGQDVPEFTAVKAYPALSQGRTSPQRCKNSNAAPPRRQQRGFRRGGCR